eukprot:833028-Prymnesium_polylepis.1
MGGEHVRRGARGRGARGRGARGRGARGRGGWEGSVGESCTRCSPACLVAHKVTRHSRATRQANEHSTCKLRGARPRQTPATLGVGEGGDVVLRWWRR